MSVVSAISAVGCGGAAAGGEDAVVVELTVVVVETVAVVVVGTVVVVVVVTVVVGLPGGPGGFLRVCADAPVAPIASSSPAAPQSSSAAPARAAWNTRFRLSIRSCRTPPFRPTGRRSPGHTPRRRAFAQ